MSSKIRRKAGRILVRVGRNSLVILLYAALLVSDFVGVFTVVAPQIAEAAQVTIDGSVNTTGASHHHAGSQTVFISDTTGYKFYRDSSGECAYAKTTNAGGTWAGAVLIDDRGNAVDCVGIAVWYDQWTPNATATEQFIHVATMSSKDVLYNRVDTANSDTRLGGSTAISASTSTLQVGTYAVGTNYPSITKGTDGTVYIAADDTSDSFVVECSTVCQTTTNWTESGTRPQDLANDYSILMPLTNGHIMIINRDISLEDIRSKIWNNSAWSTAWVTIDGNATDNTTYDVGLAATLASSTAAATTTTFLAYTADNTTPGTDDDIRTARYSNGLWTLTTNVLTNDAKGVTNVAIGRDLNTGNIYVGYNARTTPGTATTGNTYWKMSTTSMSSWSTESAAVNSSADDFYGVDLPMSSNQRMYISWEGVALDDIFADTIADLVPGVVVSTSSAQTAEVTASTTDFHVGGAFVINEMIGSRTVTDITIEETGSIDAQTGLKNIRLQYENDTTFPYDCASVSYDGGESLFAAADADGFSGANGSSTFSGGTAVVATTSALCLYPVMDVIDAAENDTTINIAMGPPSTYVAVSDGGEVAPTTSLDMVGSTVVKNDALTQINYHWRNDDGSEVTATSRTGGSENTNLTALQQSTPARIRFAISNEGGTTSPSTQYRLEYSEATSTCEEAYLWTDVGASDDEWNMFNSSNLTDGADTTDIATASGGVTNENLNFLTPNAAVKDTSSQTAGISATSTQFIELEYSIVASTTAPEGNTYCFRLTSAGDLLFGYTRYPRATIAADVTVSATSSQTATADVPTQDFYIGGAYVITENASSRNVTSITITEEGTVDGTTGLDNVRLQYDLDTSAPYDCLSESYGGGELQFGSTDTDGFSSANGTSTFSDSVAITTTQTMCIYPVMDIRAEALNAETIDIVVDQPNFDVKVTGGGTVSPSIPRDIIGSTTLRAAILTQMRYHWRRDTGPEATSTSYTNGIEGTALGSLYDGNPARLRLLISNEGVTTSPQTRFRLEYGQKITTCSAVASWTDVGDALGAWDMYDSPNLTNGADTTDIAVATGGVTNENTTFLTPNAAVSDTSSLSASTTLSETQFIELEYAIEQTESAGFSTTYCFRSSKNGVPLESYTLYPELTTAAERDFKVQHGTSTVTGTSLTLTAGVDYVAPSASTSAFIRITNSQHTGAGSTLTGTQNADDVTASILNPWNIMTSVTFTRPATAINNTRVSWEIVEFTGKPGSDNEMIVRQQEAVTYAGAGLAATGTPVASIADDADVVVFITGQRNPDTGTADYNTGLSTASWASTTDEAVFDRAEAGADAVVVSYAVVEFTGRNWLVQRASHTYTAAGTVETEDIAAVNSTSRTFIHTQKRAGTALAGTDEYGHEIWLSSVGQLSLRLEPAATSPNLQTSVVWVIENIQSTAGAMLVTRSSGTTTGGTEPLTVGIAVGATVSDPENTSIFINNRASLTTSLFPRPILGAIISTSTTHYQLWRSDTGAAAMYQTEIVEWPVAGTVLRQNDYQFYVDNNAVLPTDPWPPGGTDLGENASITADDEPLGGSERLRIRMSLTVINSSLPANVGAFTLQYGERVTSCSAIGASNWYDLGDAGSTTALWRGFNATGTTDGTALSADPPTVGDLKLSESEVAGTLEEENTSVDNPYLVEENEDVEYDWIVEQNSALASTTYCFRMVEPSGTALNAYFNYPQMKTADFDPATQDWRWYNDENNETPVTALAGENIAPIDVVNDDPLKLRIAVKERENVAQDNTRFRLQFSEYSDFSTSTFDVVATSTCTGSSTWCYANGAGEDNEVISTKVLSDSDTCAGSVGRGCGTHTESTTTSTGFTQVGSSTAEYEFTIKPDGPRVNRIYYFRLYDMVRDVPVPLNSGESYPSLATEGAQLVLTVAGLATSTVTEGVTTDIASTPNRIAYGTLSTGVSLEAAQRLTVTTNATEGYQTMMYTPSMFISASGESIPNIAASNTAPSAWAAACSVSSWGCYGYHAGDDTLQGGSARFAPDDTYAAPEIALREVAYSSIPVTNDIVDIVFRVIAYQQQPAGQYQTEIVFITSPSF